MLQLRQLHLQTAFVGTRPLGENIQNQTGAVEHAAFHRALQVAFLAGAQAVVEQHHVGLVLTHQVRQLLGLAGTDEQRRVGAVALAQQLHHRLHPGGGHQMMKFVQVLAAQGVGQVDMHQHRFLTGAGTNLFCTIE